MSPMRPDLLTLIGDGFVDDAYAADGNHLRWMFEPSLGFPRYAFCLERRPSVGTPEGQQGVEVFIQGFRPDPPDETEEVDRLVRRRLAIYRSEGKIRLEPKGVALEKTPMLLDFHAGTIYVPHPQVCWVRLWFKVQVPGAWLLADALRLAGGAQEVVARQTREYLFAGAGLPLHELDKQAIAQEMTAWRKFSGLMDNPERSLAPPKLPAGAARQLYKALKALNPGLYSLVTKEYINSLQGALAGVGLRPEELAKWSRWMHVQVDLQAEFIDCLALSGKQAWLEKLEWVYTNSMESASGWQPVGCYPMVTQDTDYRDRNGRLFPPGSLRNMAERVVMSPRPRGAEPLDEHRTPPTRPPTDAELQNRYVEPWVGALEPWLHQVLENSLDGAHHQSETILTSPLTEAGQPGVHIEPVDLSSISNSPTREATMEVRPYPLLLAAATAYPVARLLGLAAIDNPPAGVEAWDYRLTGRWLISDWRAWLSRLVRDLERLSDEAESATPARRSELVGEFVEVDARWEYYRSVIDAVTEGRLEGELELTAIKLGVRARRHALFAGPGRLQAQLDGLGMPPDGLEGLPRADAGIKAVARLEWPLRQRSHVIIAEDIPLGSALFRGLVGVAGPFPETLNPVHPDFGVTSAILPTGPEDDRGAAGTAVYFDHHVADGEAYRYGLSEVDPFGRWSRLVQTTFRWDYNIPPPEPVHVAAALRQWGDSLAYQLEVTFLWSQDLNPVTGHRFRIYLRRSAPPADRSNHLEQWHGLERMAGSGAGYFEFSAEDPVGGNHDDMLVQASRESTTITDSQGEARDYWKYTTTFTGLELSRDALERARAWVAVATYDELHDLSSQEAGGPALAEHVLATPPPAAVLPPVDRATYADADGYSSYTLRWEGAENQRYVVYRAGEREVVRCLEYYGVDVSDYNSDLSVEERAAVLRRLAAQPRAEEAFQPRSDLVPPPPPEVHEDVKLQGTWWPNIPAGPLAFSDTLQGQLRTLTVYAVLGRSRSGVRSEWPTAEDCFVIVQVPHLPQPSRPAVLRATWKQPSADRGGEGWVELQIAEPLAGSAQVAALEVYRTQDQARAADYHRMRPLHRLDNPEYLAPDPETTPTILRSQKYALYQDDSVQPWQKYYYRVVARAPGASEGRPGMRSEASAPVGVQTMSTQPPRTPDSVLTLREIDPISEEPVVRISFQTFAPQVPAGEFSFQILRQDESLGFLLVARASAYLVRHADAEDWFTITLPDESLPAGVQFIVRIQDPLGHTADTEAVTAP